MPYYSQEECVKKPLRRQEKQPLCWDLENLLHGNSKRCWKKIRKASKLFPDTEVSWSKWEKLDAARIQYEKALEINPSHVDSLCNYGCLLYRLKKMDEAEEAYKKALILDSRNVDAHCGYGILLYKQGKKNRSKLPLHSGS